MNKNCIRFKSPGIISTLYTVTQSTVVCLSGVISFRLPALVIIMQSLGAT